MPRDDHAAGDEFSDQPWLSYTVVQGPKTVVLDELYAGLMANRVFSRPLYAQETLWSGNRHGHPDYSDDELRKNAYVILMSGAALNFADNGGPMPGQVGNSSSGFSGTLALEDRRQWRHDILRRVWDTIESVPFCAMRPCRGQVSAGYCLADADRRLLVYLPYGGTVEVSTVGEWTHATWINAQDVGDRRSASPDGGDTLWAAPTDGDDWLLYLER
jgi:hypothetical protein